MSDKVHRYEGDQVDVTWDGRLCIHIGECGRASGELFVGGRKPWCQPDLGGDTAAVEDVVRRCPTGALFAHRADGTASEQAEDENVVVIANNGPLYVRGDLAVDGATDDMPGVAFRAALCRCGLSKNKPFCDNSHEEGGFVDRGAVGDTGPGTEGATGALTVSRAPNGPLLLNGPFVIVAGSGQRRWSGTKAALCRCGQSKNKPFCDGSHRDAGFTAD